MVKEKVSPKSDLILRARRESDKMMKSKLFCRPDFVRRILIFLADFSLQSIPKFSFSEVEYPEKDAVDIAAWSFLKEHEKELFLAYNYCRWRLSQLMADVNGQALAIGKVKEIDYWFGKTLRIREFLSAANLRLVIAMAKRTKLTGIEHSELICIGNEAVARAIDKFDAERGFKFSTYACRAILAQFSREFGKAMRHSGRFKQIDNLEILDGEFLDCKRAVQQTWLIEDLREIMADHNNRLTTSERQAVAYYYGLKGDEMTLAQVGKKMGLSSERTRQIVKVALAKMKDILEAYRGAL